VSFVPLRTKLFVFHEKYPAMVTHWPNLEISRNLVYIEILKYGLY
jgi:hypothetical protein